MRKTLEIVLVVLTTGLFGVKARGQVDPHFTQYYVYPAWLNPALTGAFDGTFRVAGIHRNQWGNISAPFSTFGVSGEITTDKNLNVGISAMKQTAGDGGYGYTTAYASLAYTGLRFGTNETQRISFGMQAGMIQRRFDRSKMTFGDQWNPIFGFNPGSTSAEVLARTSATSFDIGAGVLYFDAKPGKKINLFGGFSASHITRPDDHFSATGSEKFPVRYTTHAGFRWTLSNMFSITPNFLYLSQGSASEKMVGVYGQYKASQDVNVMLGANYRVDDAISPFFGFTYRGMMVAASYDINNSDLGKMANGTNSFEISVSFIGRKSTKTPEVDFICPRL
jgi:type IX secretion system PorP/SprF family membrane protein